MKQLTLHLIQEAEISVDISSFSVIENDWQYCLQIFQVACTQKSQTLQCHRLKQATGIPEFCIAGESRQSLKYNKPHNEWNKYSLYFNEK